MSRPPMRRPDFPRSLPEFFRMFPDEAACLRFVIDSRWPGGDKTCAKCDAEDFYPRKDRPGGLECARCGYTLSATAGTAMEGTRLPLCTWLQAAFLVVTDKRGLSAKQLQRDLAVKRYETAWTMLQKLRAAMVNPQREPLLGVVEVDETFVGGPVPGKRGRGTAGGEGKFIVLGAVEVREGVGGLYPGRIRLRHVADFRAPTLLGFVEDLVEASSTVVTDDLKEYRGLADLGYEHRVESTTRGLPQEAVLPHLHLVFSNLKTWLHGTFHGAVGRAAEGGERGKHLEGYLNEFVFRFNRRGNLFAAFQTLLGIAGRTEAPTQRVLYATGAGRHAHPNPRRAP